jgi:hypothetical protein
MTRNDEQTAIEQAFIVSWDFVEEHFSHRKWIAEMKEQKHHSEDEISSFQKREQQFKPMLNLIAELRRRGYDCILRAGQQLTTLVLSRAKVHGLGGRQGRLDIYMTSKKGMDVRYYEYPDTHIQFEQDRVELTPELEALLERLAAQPID